MPSSAKLTALESNGARFRAIFGAHRSPSLRPDVLRFPNDEEFMGASWAALDDNSMRLWYTDRIVPHAPFLWVTQEAPGRAPAHRFLEKGAITYHASAQDWLDDAAGQLTLLAQALGARRINPPLGSGLEVMVSCFSDTQLLLFHVGKGEYVRIISRDKNKDSEELAYWDVEEFAVDPVSVCGALVGALQFGADASST